MTMLLGGRVAEQLVFGAVTTGAADDLKRVSEIARAMVHDYAMGTPGTAQRAVTPGDGDSEQSRAHPRRGAAGAGLRGASRGAARCSAATATSSTSSPTRCSTTRCSSARTSTRSWPACRAWSAARASPGWRSSRRRRTTSRRRHQSPPLTPASPCPRRVPRRLTTTVDRAGGPGLPGHYDAGMFTRIDHIGVAVEDIDAALELYERDYVMTLVHRETVDSAGRRGGPARRRRKPHRAAGPDRSRHAGRQVPRQEGPGDPSRRLPGDRTSRRPSRRSRRPDCGSSTRRRARASATPASPSCTRRRRAAS